MELGINERSYQGYEGGVNFPGGKIIEGLVKLGADANWLLTGEAPPSSAEEAAFRASVNKLSNATGARLQGEAITGGKIKKDYLEEIQQLAFNYGLTGIAIRGLLKDYRNIVIEEIYDDYVSVPLVSGVVSAGGGVITDDAIEKHLTFRRDWIQRKGDPKQMAAVKVRGDSMAPTLNSGDVVLVNLGRRDVEDNAIFVIGIDDHTLIKRLRVTPGGIRVVSDNPNVEPQTVERSQLTVFGKVIWSAREF